ncbi:MAG: PHP domain-containing protein [Elusimicrobiota bacterium]|jgi:DNA polymerase-3 subunit alpha|nr:PHP domain-containing protein [Elusimicrobiota bacterium]
MENFVNLHNHSIYSLYDALDTPEDLVKRAAELNQPGIALTDHGMCGGWIRFYNSCKKFGIKSIFGIENYCIDKLEEYDEKKKRIRQKNNHVILLIKNDEGYRNLLRLNYEANKDETHFYYKPRNSFEELFKYSKGLIVSSACSSSGFANLLAEEKEDEAEKLFLKFLEVFKDNFYAELQINEMEFQKKYNQWLIDIANKNGVPIILTADSHYIDKDGGKVQEFSFYLRSDDDKEVGEQFQCHHLYLHNINDFKEQNQWFKYDYSNYQIEGWCKNTIDILNKINFIFPERNKMLLPRQAFDEDEELMKLTRQGLMKHFGVDKYEDCPLKYRERVKTELELIIRKGVSRYFLLLNDMAKFANENDIWRGPARGSAGGSIVCCCLNIIDWQMDGIENNLIFERFVSNSRLSDSIIDYY